METMSATDTANSENTGPRMGGPIMEQPTFDCSVKDKYTELRNFKLEMKNMHQNFNISQAERDQETTG